MDIEAICEFEGGFDAMWYVTRGHVDKAEFAAAVEREYGRKTLPEEVEHVYTRIVPQGDKLMIILAKKGRGASPTTMLDLM